MSHKTCKHQDPFSRGFASVDEPVCQVWETRIQVVIFEFHLNDLGKLREILLWIRLLTTAGRNNFRFTKFPNNVYQM